jgi:peptidoglycan hydrolase CwlO-like protein
MKRQILAATLLTLLTFTSPALCGAPSDDDKTTLQELLAENKNLIVQLNKAEKVKGEIAKAGFAIEGEQAAVKHAQQELRRKGTRIDEQQQEIDTRAQAAGCPWGGSSPDKAFVASCNSEGAKLNAMLKEVQEKKKTLVEYARELDKRQAMYSDLTIKWSEQKKENNADLQVLYDARSDWQRRYNTFVFHSETYERLKKTAPAVRVCEEISAPMTDEELRRAAQCLQRLWDGTR